jgi:hypothetical protein
MEVVGAQTQKVVPLFWFSVLVSGNDKAALEPRELIYLSP